MKNVITIFILALLCQLGISQSSPGFKYQTVLRDMSRQVLVNQPVSFLLTIHESSPTGTEVFSDSYSIDTDQMGRVSINIQNTSTSTGDLEDIDWGNGDYFLNVKTDVGNGLQDMGTSIILGAPFAFAASTALDDGDKDATNELQDWADIPDKPIGFLDGIDDVEDDDADPENELIEDLILTGTTLEIEEGGYSISVDLSALQDGVIDDDANPTNEIQTLSKSGNEIILSNNGGSITLNDDDATNELQSLDLDLGTNTLYSRLPNGQAYSSIDLSTYFSLWNVNNNFLSTSYPRVGVGTGNPGAKLEVRGADSNEEELLALFRKDNADGANRQLMLRINPTIPEVSFLTDGSGGANPRLSLHAGAGDNPQLVLTPNGNVGVGTNTPTAGLDVHGTVSAFGEWQTQSYPVYVAPQEANSDGFVVVHYHAPSNCSITTVWGYTGNSEDLGEDDKKMGISIDPPNFTTNSFMMPVRKGDYWMVNTVSELSYICITVNWMPLGK